VKFKALPLTSPNWWPLDKTLQYIEDQLGHHLARHDFLAAVNEGRLPTKVEQYGRVRKSWLLTAKLRREQELIRAATYYFRPRRDDIQPIRGAYAMFFWVPALKQIWPELSSAREETPPPSESESESESERLHLPSRKPPGPPPENDWKVCVACEFGRRVGAGEPEPTAAAMLGFCAAKWDWEPALRTMQNFLKQLHSLI
jgi:hypothetical protein